MVMNPSSSNSNNSEQLALKGLTKRYQELPADEQQLDSILADKWQLTDRVESVSSLLLGVEVPSTESQ